MGEIPVNSMAFNGERLKIARIYRDLTATELADKLGVKRQTISMYENGKLINPEIEKIHDMSRILDFPMNFFLEKSSDDVKIAPSTYFRSLLTTNKKYRFVEYMHLLMIILNFLLLIFLIIINMILRRKRLTYLDSIGDYLINL